MVKELCLNLLVFAFVLCRCRVSAFHPIPNNLPAQNPNDDNEGFSTENSVPLQRIELIRLENEIDKRGPDRNFLRFGKADNSLEKTLYIPEEFTEEEKKAARNFLRFGRVPQRNFLRFGRSGNPMAFGLGLVPDEKEEFVKRHQPSNFYRYGKAADRNFLRFGRSTNSQNYVECKDCIKKENGFKEGSSNQDKKHISSETKESNRMKRSVAAFYDDAEFFPHTHVTWTPPQFSSLDPASQAYMGGNEDLASIAQKRAHSRSFLRYGRDPLDLHFLRFGKRGSSEEDKASNDVSEEDFNRYIRGRTTKNFIRFG